ncbi:MAG: hypothetical protein HYX96_01500 [Chloroflexi bacterium]|nr:hypothetical protein [Chloroflexota bacterium]
MKIPRVLVLLLLMAALLVAYAPGVLAEETPTPEPPPIPAEKIEVLPIYPKIENIAGSSFSFEIELKFLNGDSPKVFDLRATGPQGWDVYMTPQYEKEKKISAIRLEPAFTVGTKIQLVANAPFFPLPDPGQYKIKLEAISGELNGSAEITAAITARYNLLLVPALDGRYNTNAEAGKEGVYSIKVQNYGTAPVDKVNFSSTQPDGWSIEFLPDKVDTLGAFEEKSIDVKIKPAAKTIAGDYMITLNASGNQYTAQKMDVRVTVDSPTVWGWVGVAIILFVAAGLVLVFLRFSRR